MNRVRLALYVWMFCNLSMTGLAQEERATPVVTAAAPVEKVRFAGSPTSAQMRIEVRSSDSALVYDSDWKDGNILDWLPRDSSGQPLAFGAYRLLMQSKNLDGQTSEQIASLHVDSGGMAVDGQSSSSPRMTLTAHDGDTGQLITTSGDLSFRFGDFLNRRDTEAMRLTPAGELRVNGLIHAKGVMFPDGTILTTAAGMATVGDGGSVMRQRPSAPATTSGSSTAKRGTEVRPPILRLNPPAVSAARPTPRPNFAPAFQFVVGDTGVSVGTTNPAYNLDVTGTINTASQYKIGGVLFAHNFGNQNTFLGVNAGNLVMSGYSNTAIGDHALPINGPGYYNTASGANALLSNVSGSNNTAIGFDALHDNNGPSINLQGSYNTASGYGALTNNTTGSFNTASGANAVFVNTTGTDNTASGYGALFNNTGAFNIAVGSGAGQNLTTGDANIDIGNQGVAAEGGTIRIGAVQSRTFIAGIRSTITGAANAIAVLIDSNGQLGTVSSSRRYKFDINDMGDATDGLMRLRPVTFRYLAHGDNAPVQYGLIAEEVAEVYPELVTQNKDGEVDTVMYQFLAPMLLNAVQKQQRQIEDQQAESKMLGQITTELKADNAALRSQLERLLRRVEQLEGKPVASQ